MVKQLGEHKESGISSLNSTASGKPLALAAIQMSNLSPRHKLKFFDFLISDEDVDEIETYIKTDDDLESELRPDDYIELLTFDFKDKDARLGLEDFLFQRIISEGEFETWKITKLLRTFINEPSQTKELLDEFYHLYITYNRKGEFTNGYRFLGHLGLNYFYWMDRSYLQSSYGDKWQQELEKSLGEVEFYHRQLRPIAEQILEAIEQGQIRIVSRGVYQIDEQIKKDLEGDEKFQLKHPRGTGS